MADSNQRNFYRQPVDVAVQVKVTGLKAPVPAQLVDISGTGCRLRSTVSIEKNTKIAFDWRRGGLPPIPLRGTVAAKRRQADNALNFEYGISFEDMREAEVDKVVNAIMELQRRTAVNRAAKREPEVT